jgi:hypothetical protein
MNEHRSDVSLSSLIGDLKREAMLLIRREVELAQAEASEKVGQITRGGISLGTGGVVLFIGLLFLMLAVFFWLSNLVAPWLSALIVGGVVLAIGGIMLLVGLNRMKTLNMKPERTLETLREDAKLVRGQAR